MKDLNSIWNANSKTADTEKNIHTDYMDKESFLYAAKIIQQEIAIDYASDEEIEKLADIAVEEGIWGFPNIEDAAGKLMADNSKEYFIKGYKAAHPCA